MSKPGGTVRSYWDSCLFLDLINVTTGRAEVLGALWDELVATDSTVIAVTSILSVAEVAFATHEKNLQALDPKALLKIEGFWSPSSPIEMVELYFGVAFEARQMIRQALSAGHSLKPHDAIHFAAAKKRGCAHFLTYDDKLYKFSGAFGFTVKEPKSEQLPFATK